MTSLSSARAGREPSRLTGRWQRCSHRWDCRLRPAKTSLVCLTRGGGGFDFLGFHHHKVESWRWRGRWYLQRWPSQRAMLSVRAKIRSLTDRRFVGWPVEMIVARLNRVLRGWAAYFRHGNSARGFAAIGSYVHERLAIWASNKHGRHGRNWQHRYTAAWLARLGVYRLNGQVRYETAHASR
jgi:RNA-directed DNA polymerase